MDSNQIVNIALITSFREIVGDELVGQQLDLSPHMGTRRRIGNIEDIVRRANVISPGSFGKAFNVVAVLADDWPEALDKLFADGEHDWPWPVGMSTVQYAHGSVESLQLDDRTTFLSSQPWRRIARKHNPEIKSQIKGSYERALVELLDRAGADLLVSDSYTSIMGPYKMPRFDGGLLDAFSGRALNIHPAVVAEGHPNRLPGLYPTRDAIARFRETGYNRTGATVHLIDAEIDHGPAVLWREDTVIRPEDGEHELCFAGRSRAGHLLRERNYTLKRELLPAAIAAHVQQPAVQQRIATGRVERAQRVACYGQDSPTERYAAFAEPMNGSTLVQRYEFGTAFAARGLG